MKIEYLTAVGIAAVLAAALILPLIYVSTGSRRRGALKWMRSDTRGAKVFRVFFGEPGVREPLCFPNNPNYIKKSWIIILIVTTMLLGCLGLILGNSVPLMRLFPGLRRLNLISAITATLLALLWPFTRSNHWPSALTKELIEDLYRPQIERLREISTHWRAYAENCELRGAPPETDFALFSIPSVFSAGVATGLPNEWASVGSLPKILEKSRFRPRKPEMSDTKLLPGWVKLSDYSRKNAVIYSGALTDDQGERREFELCLNLKMVISQIPKAPA